MGFDKNNQPLLQPQKKTTKVNFGVVGGVLLFLVIGFIVFYWFLHHHPQSGQITGP